MLKGMNVQRLGKFNVFAAEEPIGNAENYCDGKYLQQKLKNTSVLNQHVINSEPD